MVTFGEGLEMFSFSVMKSTFCLAYIEFIAILAASFVDNSRHLRAVQAILVRKVGFDAACVLAYETSSLSKCVYLQCLSPLFVFYS